MLHYVLLIILLTTMLFPRTECSASALSTNGRVCSGDDADRSHYDVMMPFTVPIAEGANTNLAFLVHNDGNNSLKYSRLMNDIIMMSYEYKHEIVHTSGLYLDRSAHDALKKRLDMYSLYTKPTDNVVIDTRIDSGFHTVERKFKNYDCSYVPNLCILLTTSPADNKYATTAAAKSLLDSGVNIMAIAVGDDVDKDDVKDFASNEKYAFATGKNMSEQGTDMGRHINDVTRKITITAGKNISDYVDAIGLHADDVTRKIKTALMQAHALPKYTRCFEAGHIFIIIDVAKNHFETLTQLRDFVIDFDSIFASVKTVMINSPTDDEIFLAHLSSVERSTPGVSFQVFDSSYNLSSSITSGRQVLLNSVEAYEKIITVVTDRKIDDIDDVIAVSRTCQNLGVHIMALGVGDEVEDFKNQLSQIITDPSGIEKIESLKYLKSGLRKIYRKICSSTCGCHSGWAYYNGRCFSYKSESQKWLAAQKICEGLRAKLVSITTPEKYAWLKNHFLDKLKKPVHIGLRKYQLKSVPIGRGLQWENGKPLLFSDWDQLKTPPEPDGVSYEECVAWYPDGWRDVVCEAMIDAGFICERKAFNVTEEPLKGVEILPLGQENVCSEPKKSFDPRTGPIIVSGNACRPLLSVHWQPREMKNIFSCSNGEIISQFLQCDGVSHCQDGSDEKHCSADCTEYQFQCSNGRCVSLAYFCDFWDDCGDNSDEDTCVSTRCQSGQWQCDNGQCIPVNARCDLHYDCYDKSDETLSCSGIPRNSKCDDGTHIPDHWLRDGQVDCGGGRFEDEIEEKSRRLICYEGKYKQLFYLFIANYNATPSCTMVFDGFGKHFESFTSPTEDCKANDTMCPIGFYRCPSSFCIPIEKVCDGVMDCIDGEEEAGCDTYECPGYYRCPGASYCLHPSRICDGEVNCPGGKDEVMCDVKCHEGCNCSAGVVECTNIVKNIASSFDRSARKIVLTESLVLEPHIVFKGQYYLIQVVLSQVGLQTLNGIFDHQINLINLNISHNNISELSPRVLSKLKKLIILDISYNPLKNMSTESFAGLVNLRELYIRYTSIEILDKKLFSALTRLELLDVRGSSVHTIVDETFFGLGQLRQLYMQGNTIKLFGHRIFDGLDRLEKLHTDMYSLCCSQVRPRSLAEADCLSPKSSISSCNDLLASDFLRSSVWILCIASVVGNVVSLVIRLVWERNSMQNGFGVFVTHLGIADFLMGVYLLIITVADTQFKGKYIWNDYEWRHSNYCKIAGTLSTLSSEASTFFICLITLDRFLVIRFPFSLFKFRSASASVVAVLAWVVASAIATVPLIPSLSHWNFYIKNGACLALPFATEKHPGWIYSVAIFTGLNFVAFILIAVGQYSIYRAVKKGSIVSSASRKAQDMAIARKLVYIVVTDFLCWFPVGILSILALTGVSFGGEVYAWTAVFILPVNSALNPFLYTIPAVLQRIMEGKQTPARKTETEVSKAKVRIRIGDPDPRQVRLEDVLRQLKAKEDRVKLMKDIWEGLTECLMTRTGDQPQPNTVYLGLRGKVVDSVCLATSCDASVTDWVTPFTSLVNTPPDDE